METITNKIIGYLDSDENIWDDVDRARMALGLQVLIHNFIMISVILIIAQMVGIPGEAVILLVAYGLLKITAGGIHFKKSATCLLGTGVFVIAGVLAFETVSVLPPYVKKRMQLHR